MLRRFSVNFAIFSMTLDIGLTLLALSLAAYIRPFLPPLPFLVPVPSYEIPLSLYVIVPLLWGLAFLLISVYDPRRIYKAVDEFQNVTLAVALAALIFAGVLYLGFREFSRWLLVTFVLFDLCFLLGWRAIARFIFNLGHAPAAGRRVLIVGAGDVGRRVGQMIREYGWTGLDLAGYLDDDSEKGDEALALLGGLQDLRLAVETHQINDVVIALPQRAYGQVNKLVLVLHDLPVQVRVVPDYFSLALYRAAAEDFGGVPMINLRDPALNDVQRLVKRLFDLAIGGALALLALPLISLIAGAIRLDSAGPVIFRQQRIGENGRLFGMFKFRTMIDGAEALQNQVTGLNEDGRIVFKHRNDPRITRVGRILRRTSLDELPQLFNVLIGDMSLVGPRPELPWLADQYEPWQRKRFAVPQGMTGWWQVNGRADKPMHLNTDDDLYYVQNYSLWMDIYILLKTPWVVMRGQGAY